MTRLYTSLSLKQTKDFCKKMKGLDPQKSKIYKKELPFLKNWTHYDCDDFQYTPPKRTSYLEYGDDIKPVIYSDNPLNDNFLDTPISLTAETVKDYMNLYLKLWVKQGEFMQSLQDSDDIPWIEDISPMMKKSLNEMLINYPVVEDHNNYFIFTTAVLFRQSLIKIVFSVKNTGQVTVEDREILIEDLPVDITVQ